MELEAWASEEGGLHSLKSRGVRNRRQVGACLLCSRSHGWCALLLYNKLKPWRVKSVCVWRHRAAAVFSSLWK